MELIWSLIGTDLVVDWNRETEILTAPRATGLLAGIAVSAMLAGCAAHTAPATAKGAQAPSVESYITVTPTVSSAPSTTASNNGNYVVSSLCELWCVKMSELGNLPSCDAQSTSCTDDVTQVATTVTDFMLALGASGISLPDYPNLRESLTNVRTLIDGYDFDTCTVNDADEEERSGCEASASIIFSAGAAVGTELHSMFSR